jgi:hypothetical protein
VKQSVGAQQKEVELLIVTHDLEAYMEIDVTDAWLATGPR